MSPVARPVRRRATGQTFDPAPATRWLLEQYRQRAGFGPFPAAVAPRTLAQAHIVQRAFAEAKARACGPAVGWKIALASPVMQQMVGLDSPVSGRLHRDQVVSTPAHTRGADYGRLIVEFEIAVRLGRDLGPDGPALTAASVVSAVSALGPALELADDRRADYALLARNGLQLVADNAWNQGVVLGCLREDWAALDLDGLRGEAFINGHSVGAGRGADLMGGPLSALAWLVNDVRGRGETLRAGEIVMLGSLVTSKFPVAGDRLVYRLEGFEPVELQIN